MKHPVFHGGLQDLFDPVEDMMHARLWFVADKVTYNLYGKGKSTAMALTSLLEKAELFVDGYNLVVEAKGL